MNNPETFVVTHNRFIIFLIIIFIDINEAQIYGKPLRDIPHHEIETFMTLNYPNLFGPIEHTEDLYNRGPNDKNFPIEIEDKKYIFVGEKVFSFKTTDKIVECSSNDGLNDVKYTYAHGIENIYFMLYRKHIHFEEYKN